MTLSVYGFAAFRRQTPVSWHVCLHLRVFARSAHALLQKHWVVRVNCDDCNFIFILNTCNTDYYGTTNQSNIYINNLLNVSSDELRSKCHYDSEL